MNLFVIFNNMTKKQQKEKNRLKMGKKTRSMNPKMGLNLKKS